MNFEKYKGLTNNEVIKYRNEFGTNELIKTKKRSLIIKILYIFKEPTMLLLLIASLIYFLLGNVSDGIIMLISVLFTCFLEFIQEYRTDKALEELNKLASLDVKVIRNGNQITIPTEELVVNDIVILQEGDNVPADGILLDTAGLGINESALTGESIVIYKTLYDNSDNYFKKNMCYKGTSVTNGMGIMCITGVGISTEYGKIGKLLNDIEEEEGLLNKQVGKVVKIYTLISFILFLLVVLVTFVGSSGTVLKTRITSSLISGITVAIATIPEEIPVILTVFLALGSLKLSKKNTLAKNMKSIEGLGEITVLCTDKTGTLTMNQMTVKDDYIIGNKFYESTYLSCSTSAYDPMEISMKDYALDRCKIVKKDYKLVHEYLFNNNDKMMGQVFEHDNITSIYVKGAYESVIKLCKLTDEEIKNIKRVVSDFAASGLRVLAVASKDKIKIKDNLKEYTLDFEGLIALYDPPREGITESIKKCYEAGVRTIMITGDNGETAKGIAKMIGIKDYDEVITGEELETMSMEELRKKVKTVSVFARVYPNHKMKIVEALQKNGEIVAMTGDGINDATALKKANVGVALGEKGTSVAKESADIVIMDDNFNTIVDAIENGRTIYNNIKKAILFVFVVHIPIALLSLLIPLFGMEELLVPVHIVLLELLIDPTCSILFERIIPDKNVMKMPPRDIHENIVTKNDLYRCLFQGIIIFLVVFGLYQYNLTYNGYEVATTISYSVLIISIIFNAYMLKSHKLTLRTISEDLSDKMVLLVNSVIIIVLLCICYIPVLQTSANTTNIDFKSWAMIIVISFLTTLPYDLIEYLSYKE